jgi:hypothetical protein
MCGCDIMKQDRNMGIGHLQKNFRGKKQNLNENFRAKLGFLRFKKGIGLSQTENKLKLKLGLSKNRRCCKWKTLNF